MRIVFYISLLIFFASCKTQSPNTSGAKTIDELQADNHKVIIGEVLSKLINEGLDNAGYDYEERSDIGIAERVFSKSTIDNKTFTNKRFGSMVAHTFMQVVGSVVTIFTDASMRDTYDQKVVYWADRKDREHAAAFTFKKHTAGKEDNIEIILTRVWIQKKLYQADVSAEKMHHPRAIYYFQRDKEQVKYSYTQPRKK